MYLSDFNMMLNNKLVDCFSEISLDKNKIIELENIQISYCQNGEIKQNEEDQQNEEYFRKENKTIQNNEKSSKK